MPPLCSPKFQYWKQAETQQAVLTTVIQSVLESTNVLDKSQLCIEEGKAVWILYIDVYCLSNDGNLLDASLIAVLAALKNGLQLFVDC